VRVYNPIPEGQEASYADAILREYRAFCQEQH